MQAQKVASLCEQLGRTFPRLTPNSPMTDVSDWYINLARRLKVAGSVREIDQDLALVYTSLKQGRGGPMDGYATNKDGSVDEQLSRHYRGLIEELQGLTRGAWLKRVLLGRNRGPGAGVF
jgi:hypothetical protein